MFKPGETFCELQAVKNGISVVMRRHLIADFIDHLEEEYKFDTIRVKGDVPTILVWLGQAGSYYEIVKRYRSKWEHVSALSSSIGGLFSFEHFARTLSVGLNERFAEENASYLIVGTSKIEDDSEFDNDLTFEYDPTYAWGD